MERLLRMCKEQFVEQLHAEVDRVLGEIADAVNDAPDGQVINASEMKVRELMGQLRTRVYQKALQMRIDSTESSFSPSAGRIGQPQAEQGPLGPDGADGQRSGGVGSDAVARRRRGKR
jgi:hypothetical protein